MDTKSRADRALAVLAMRLQEARTQSGLTQEAAAERAGIDWRHLQRLESSTGHNATVRTLVKLCAVYQVTLGELFTDTGGDASPG